MLTCIFESHLLERGGLIGSETTAQAAAALTDYIAGADERPARTGCDIATTVTGFFATQAILAWLHGGRVAGAGHVVRVSTLRSLMTLKTILWAARSRPDSWSGTHVRSRDRLVDSGYATADRRITLDFPLGGADGWLGFAAELGLDPEGVDRLRPSWHETVGWGDDIDASRPAYEALLAELSAGEAVDLIRRHGGSSVVFQSATECADHPQARALELGDTLATSVPWRLEARGAHRVAPPRAPDPERPLAGVRVVDLGVGGVGPFSATLLGWLGADVVKVEAPNEFILAVRPTVAGLSSTYLALNQGKRSVALDLKQEADRELAFALIDDADVVIENFRPGALARIGFGFEGLASRNPALVYCSASGFGWTGPLRDEPCTDPHMQAFSGFAAGNAGADGRPRRIRYYAFMDLVTSAIIAEAVCAGLLVRATDGGPVQIETSMLHAAMEAQAALREEADCPDGVFETADGYIALTCRSDDEWLGLVDLLPAGPLLESDRFRERAGRLSHRDELCDALGEALLREPSAAWERALAARGVPCSRVLHDDEVLDRKGYWDLGLLRSLPIPGGPDLVAGGPPWSFGSLVPGPTAPAPGGDTEALRSGSATFWEAR
jgi:crotonobetainyl-CoA:carnitine CoA-transferase CaiB-like acyl-CoA transferase